MNKPSDVGCVKVRGSSHHFRVKNIRKFFEAISKNGDGGLVLPDKNGSEVPFIADEIYPCSGDGEFYMGTGVIPLSKFAQELGLDLSSFDDIKFLMY